MRVRKGVCFKLEEIKYARGWWVQYDYVKSAVTAMVESSEDKLIDQVKICGGHSYCTVTNLLDRRAGEGLV